MLLTELLVCCVSMPPYIDASISGSMYDGTYLYSLDGVVLLIIMGKSYLIVRVYYNISIFSANKKNKLFFQHHKFLPCHIFCFKADIKFIPFLIISLGFMAVDFYGALFLYYSERSYKPNDPNPSLNSMRTKIA